MKYNQGFIGIGIIIAIVAALIVGGGAVYYATKTSAPSPQNTAGNNYYPPANQNNTANNLTQNPPTQAQQQTTTSCSPTTPPSVSVTSPNGGEIYNVGQQITLKWTTCNVPQNAIFSLAQFVDGNNNGVYNIWEAGGEAGWDGMPSPLNDGIEVITPVTLGSGTYKFFLRGVWIGSTPSIGVNDYSDNLFTIQ